MFFTNTQKGHKMIRRNRQTLHLKTNAPHLDYSGIPFIRTNPNDITTGNVLSKKVETKLNDLAETKEAIKNSPEAVTILNAFTSKLLAENSALRKYINEVIRSSNTINLSQFNDACGFWRGSSDGIGYLESRPLKISHIKFRTGTSPYTIYRLPEAYKTIFDYPDGVIELLGEYKGGFTPSGYRIWRNINMVGKDGGRINHYHSVGGTDCSGDVQWETCQTGEDLSSEISKVAHAFCLINGGSIGNPQPAELPAFDTLVNEMVSLPEQEKNRLKAKMWGSYGQ